MTKAEIARERAKQLRYSELSRESQRRHAARAAEGAAAFSASAEEPVGGVTPRTIMVEVAPGIKVKEEVFDARFGQQQARFLSKPEAHNWLNERRMDWRVANRSPAERRRLRQGVTQTFERLDAQAAEAGHFLDQVIVDHIEDALTALAKAIVFTDERGDVRERETAADVVEQARYVLAEQRAAALQQTPSGASRRRRREVGGRGAK